MRYLVRDLQNQQTAVSTVWLQQYRQLLDGERRQVTPGTPALVQARKQRRLAAFGTWLTISLDTVLLFVLEIGLNIVLFFGTFAVFVLGGHYLDNGKQIGSAINQAIADSGNWLISSTIGLALGGLAVQLSIVLVLYLRVVRSSTLSWADLGFGPALRQNALRALAIGLGLGLLAFVASTVVLSLLQDLHQNVKGQEETFKAARHSPLASFIPFAITVAITAPLAEEAFFRAYALRALTVRYGVGVGVIISSALFALLHLAGDPQIGWVTLPLFIVGAILGWGYARTGNLITNVTAHAMNNIIGLAILYYN